jgi:hypothetical protein
MYILPHKQTGATRNAGSVGILKTLQKTQHLAMLSITGTLHSTPTDLLDAYAGVLPVELMLHKSSDRALVRILTLPRSHPLQKIVERAKAAPPNKHLNSVDQLRCSKPIGRLLKPNNQTISQRIHHRDLDIEERVHRKRGQRQGQF